MSSQIKTDMKIGMVVDVIIYWTGDMDMVLKFI